MSESTAFRPTSVRRTLSRFYPGSVLTLVRCGECGYIDGEMASPCCPQCGDSQDPLVFRVEVLEDHSNTVEQRA